MEALQNNSKSSKLISAAKYILLLGIAVLLLVFAFRGINVNKVFSEMLKANMLWVLLSALMSVIALISRAYRWNLLIEPLGYSPSLKKTTYALMIGYFANLALPRLGEISRCGALSKSESIPFNKLLGTVIVERVIDVISLIICLLIAASIEYKRLGDFFNENIINPISGKFEQILKSPFSIAIVIIILAGLLFTIIYFLRKAKQKESESKVVKLIRGLFDGVRSIANLKRPWLFIFHSFFIWLLYYFSVYIALFAFPFTDDLGPRAALFLLVAGGIAMSAPVQGGIGAYHLLVSQGLVLYGLSQEHGLTFATLIHGLQLLIIVVLGIASMLLLFSGKKNTNYAAMQSKE